MNLTTDIILYFSLLPYSFPVHGVQMCKTQRLSVLHCFDISLMLTRINMLCHIFLPLMSTRYYLQAKLTMKGMWIVLYRRNTWPSLLPICLELGLVNRCSAVLSTRALLTMAIVHSLPLCRGVYLELSITLATQRSHSFTKTATRAKSTRPSPRPR